MKTLAFAIVILFIAVAVTLFAIENPGYVLIARSPWSIEMPLTLFVPMLIVAYGIFYVALRLVARIWNIPRDVTRWKQEKNARKARMALQQALISLAEGHWIKAEAQLLSGLHHSEAPVLHYLAAASASQGQNNTEKRDEYLSLAQKHSPENSLAISMTQAYLQYLAQQHEQALATLTALRKSAPEHKGVLKLLQQVYLDLRDWTSLAELIPELRRHHVINANDLAALELETHRELLRLSLPSGSRAVLKKAWAAVPPVLRTHPELVAIYARHLIAQSEMDEAEKLLRQAIDREWNDELVDLYGRALGANTEEQLDAAEGWLNIQPQNPALLLTLGRLTLHEKLWGKARSYIERSVALHATTEACHELGSLLEQMGETEKALAYYRRGIEIDAKKEFMLPAGEVAGLKRSAMH